MTPHRRISDGISRRRFIDIAAASLPLAAVSSGWGAVPQSAKPRLEDRIRGLIYGSAIGDALGGPIEFQSAEKVHALDHPPKAWRMGEKLDAPARAESAARLRLRSYNDLRPGTESYGQWNPQSLPGTITDDTRHKLVLFHAFHQAKSKGAWPLDVKDLARAYLEWPSTRAVVGRAGYEELAKDWLEEWQFGARWVLGDRDESRSLPPERMWQSLPTCCGQMTLLPLAGMFAGRPESAYRAAYHLGFFDNGFGKDLNAALVAGLAHALNVPSPGESSRPAMESVIRTMREVDPFRFGKIRWSERAVDRWLNLALRLAREARGEPAQLFESLEKQFEHTTKWEAQVPFVVVFACLELAGHDVLAALQLSMEWGHDTDSYAQLAGAFAGALHGAGLFAPSMRNSVADRLRADHGFDLEDECRFMAELHALALERPLVKGV